MLGINLLWLPLSMIADMLTALVSPNRLLTVVDNIPQATNLGITTFVGILIRECIQLSIRRIMGSNNLNQPSEFYRVLKCPSTVIIIEITVYIVLLKPYLYLLSPSL
jgi:hypothetical protein